MTCSEQLGKDAGEQLKLARTPPDIVVNHASRAELILDALE